VVVSVSLTSPLYALFKIGSTGATAPSGTRPGLFSFERRALFDAWAATGAGLAGDADPKATARSRYVSQARQLGWRSTGVGDVDAAPTAAPRSRGMIAVSTMAAEAEPERSLLHQLAVDGDADRLRDPSLDLSQLNERDSFVRALVAARLIAQGYAPLHLAADRGAPLPSAPLTCARSRRGCRSAAGAGRRSSAGGRRRQYGS